MIPVILKGCLLELPVCWSFFSPELHLVAWRWTVPRHFALHVPFSQLCWCYQAWVPRSSSVGTFGCLCSWQPSRHSTVTSLQGRHSHWRSPQHPCVNQCPAADGQHQCSVSMRTEKLIWCFPAVLCRGQPVLVCSLLHAPYKVCGFHLRSVGAFLLPDDPGDVPSRWWSNCFVDSLWSVPLWRLFWTFVLGIWIILRF